MNRNKGLLALGWVIIVFLLPAALRGQQFGVGIILGSPTGFTGKFFLAQRSAIAASVGWSLGDPPLFHAACDYQFLFPTSFEWTDDMTGEKREIKNLVPYLGIGGRLRFRKDQYDDLQLNVGVRMGGGVEFLFSQSRFGVFLEIYPVVNVIPSTDFDFEGGLGFRFYFR